MYACVTWLCKYVLSYSLHVFVVYGAMVYICVCYVYMNSCMCAIFTHFVFGNYAVNLVV